MFGAAEEEVSLRELFDLLWSGRWIVVGMVAVFAAFGLAYALLAAPIYSASGLVQVEEDDQGLTSSLNELNSLLEGASVQTPAEIAIINSRMVLGKVVDDLNLRVSVKPKTIPIIGDALLRYLPPPDVSVRAPILGLNQFAWGGEQISVPEFNVPASLEDSPFILVAQHDGFTLIGPEGENLMSASVGGLHKEATVLGPIEISVTNLVANEGTEFILTKRSEQQMFDMMLGQLSVVEQTKDSGIIQISYQGGTPAIAKSVVDEIEDAYLEQNVARHSEEAQQSLDFLGRQLPEIKQKVDDAQAKLNAYQAEQGSADVQKETELILDQSVALEAQRLTLVQQREEAKQRFTSNHPVVQAINDQIGSIDSELSKIRDQVKLLPAKQQEIFGLMRDLDVNSQLYVTLMNSSQELQVAKAGTVGNVRIIDKALLPKMPASPNKALIVLGTVFLGGILGLAVVILKRALLPGVDRPEDIEKALGLPTYASIPYSKQQHRLAVELRQGKNKNGILACLDGADLSIEAIRSLRTSLHFAMLESSNNVMMLTGPIPGLGKSFIAANLGAVLAMTGKSVAVVDADLRRGWLHRYIGDVASPGISEYVANVCNDKETILRKTAVDGLAIIPRGTIPPNPSEILMNERFSKLVGELSESYDYVILDTPPVLPVADASIVGRLAGITFLVLKAAEHPMRTVEESVRRLNNSGVPVTGILFNQVGAKVGSYGYGHYGYTYGYGAYSYRAEKSE